MSKIVKLKQDEFRNWKTNAFVVLGKDGLVADRVLTVPEAQIVGALVAKAKQVGRGLKDTVKTAGGESFEIEVQMRAIGEGLMPYVRVDQKEVIHTRELMIRQFFAKHGNCQLRTHTGRFLKSVRDPNQSDAKPGESAKIGKRITNAPKPEQCLCRSFLGTEPGRHHTHCQWNMKVPVEERARPRHVIEAERQRAAEDAIANARPIDEPTVNQIALDHLNSNQAPPMRPAPIMQNVQASLGEVTEDTPVAFGTTPTPLTPPPELGPPSSRTLPQSEGSVVEDEPFMLVDIGTGATLREAREDEVAEAVLNEEKTGAATLILGGRPYAIIPKSQL